MRDAFPFFYLTLSIADGGQTSVLPLKKFAYCLRD